MNWECPYCRKAQIVTDKNRASYMQYMGTGAAFEENQYMAITQIRCLSPECRKITVTAATFITDRADDGRGKAGLPVKVYKLEPSSSSRTFPADIHPAIIQDYEEACAIVDASPKASATLARRCLQGMLRDSCGIVKGTLALQISELRAQVEAGTAEVRHVDFDSLDAIDALRSIGNIGAHMEKDINVIVDVDPDEARLLIDLIETLLESWYVERQKRSARFASVKALASEKAAQRKLVTPPATLALPAIDPAADQS